MSLRLLQIESCVRDRKNCLTKIVKTLSLSVWVQDKTFMLEKVLEAHMTS